MMPIIEGMDATLLLFGIVAAIIVILLDSRG